MTAPDDEPAVVPDRTAADEPPRRPTQRRDPAAMREALDDARRQLGPAGSAGGPTDGQPQTAAHQRALLRDAVANQSVPLLGDLPSNPPPGRDPDDDAQD